MRDEQLNSPRHKIQRSRKRARLFAAAAALASIAPAAASIACSLSPGYRFADPQRDAGLEPRTRVPPAPSVSVELRRGFDAGGFGSCTETGVLTLSIDDRGAAIGDAYLFTTSGRLPDGVVVPNGLIVPVELDDGRIGFRFDWLDLPPGADILAPIDATIAVRRISVFGLASTPTQLRVTHAGGKASPQTYDDALGFMNRLTQLAIALLVPLFVLGYVRQRRAWKRKLREFKSGRESESDVDA